MSRRESSALRGGPSSCEVASEPVGWWSFDESSGDTAFDGLLPRIEPYEPDLMLVCANGKYGNLDVEQAVTLTELVRPKVVAPMHYGMFASNTIDPNDFCARLHEKGSDARCEILEIMRPHML